MRIPTIIAAASKALAGLTATAILLAASSGSLLAAISCTVSDPTGTPLNVRSRPNGSIVGALHNGVTVFVSDLAADGHGQKWAKIVPLHEGKAGSIMLLASCAANQPLDTNGNGKRWSRKTANPHLYSGRLP
jgi:hypothetical protein